MCGTLSQYGDSKCQFTWRTHIKNSMVDFFISVETTHIETSKFWVTAPKQNNKTLEKEST